MRYATVRENKIYIFGIAINSLGPSFSSPFSSTHLDVYLTSERESSPCLFHFDEIDCKMVSLDYHDSRVFIPLLHTVESVK